VCNQFTEFVTQSNFFLQDFEQRAEEAPRQEEEAYFETVEMSSYLRSFALLDAQKDFYE